LARTSQECGPHESNGTVFGTSSPSFSDVPQPTITSVGVVQMATSLPASCSIVHEVSSDGSLARERLCDAAQKRPVLLSHAARQPAAATGDGRWASSTAIGRGGASEPVEIGSSPFALLRPES
jgi:hypothetical protein